ncbi:MAG: hypothetical protein Kow0068_06500 [Marinilabiliales bacterium]
MKKLIILSLVLCSLQLLNASFYTVVSSIHKVEGEPCYLVGIDVYNNSNTPEPQDDVYLGTVYARVCPKKGESVQDISPDINMDMNKGLNDTTIDGIIYPVEINLYPTPLMSNQKLNIDFGEYEFDYVSISPVNNIAFSPDNFITLNKDLCKGKASIDISKLNPGIYVVNAVSIEKQIVATSKFQIK